MTRAMRGLAWALAGCLAAPAAAWADTMNFKLLKNYSRATFKSDAPLETFVGNTAAGGDRRDPDRRSRLDLRRRRAASRST